MKFARALMLPALAAAAFLVFAATASATSLTSPAGTAYTGAIKAVSIGTVQISSGFGSWGAMYCNSSFELTPETHGAAVTTRGNLSSLTFSNCGATGSPVSKPGYLIFHTEGATANGNGTVTMGGSEIVMHIPLYGTCTFKPVGANAEPADVHFGTFTGSKTTGKTAIFDVFVNLFSYSCGLMVFIRGGYEVTTPDYLDVD